MGPEAAHCTRGAKPTRSRRCTSSCAEGLRLGALGFSTDQVVGNIGPGNTALPGQVCDDAELLAVAHALGAGPGPGPVHDGAPRAAARPRATARRSRVARAARGHERQARRDRARVRHVRRSRASGRDLLDAMAAAQARGNRVVGQVSPRPVRALDAPRRARRAGARPADAARGGEGRRRRGRAPPRERRSGHGAAASRRARTSGPAWSSAAGGITCTCATRPRSGDLRDRDLATISAATRRGPDRPARRHRAERRLRDAVRDRDAQPRRRPPRRPRRAPGRAARRQRRGRAHAEQHRQLLRGVDVAALGPRARGAVARDRGRDAHRPPGRPVRHPRPGPDHAGRVRRPRAVRPRPHRDRRRALRAGHARGRHPARRRTGRHRGERREREDRLTARASSPARFRARCSAAADGTRSRSLQRLWRALGT